MNKIKLIIITVICMCVLFTGALLGYKFGKYKYDKDPSPSVVQGDVIHTIVKRVDVNDKEQVLELANSKINIKRDFDFSNRDGVSIRILATNEFQSASVTDYIKYPKQEQRDYTYEVVGGVVLILATAVLTTYGLSKAGVLKNSGMTIRF